MIAPCDTDHDTLLFRDYFGRLLIPFENQLNPDQARCFAGPDHDAQCLTQLVSMEDFFPKCLILKKSNQATIQHASLPSTQSRHESNLD